MSHQHESTTTASTAATTDAAQTASRNNEKEQEEDDDDNYDYVNNINPTQPPPPLFAQVYTVSVIYSLQIFCYTESCNSNCPHLLHISGIVRGGGAIALPKF